VKGPSCVEHVAAEEAGCGSQHGVPDKIRAKEHKEVTDPDGERFHSPKYTTPGQDVNYLDR
jgi:hypothetical protein